MPLKQLYCILLLICFHACVQAEVVEDLYHYSYPIADRSIESRDAQFSESLMAVLMKATGGHIDFAIPIIQSALKKPERFILKWSYHENPFESEQANVSDLNLNVTFDDEAVQWLLKEAHVRAWGKLRPLCLFWLAKAEGFSRTILTDTNQESIALKEAATAIALPVVFPIMDLKEQTHVNVADVWGLFEPALVDISKPYQADLVVIGRIYNDGEKVSGEFSLMKPYEHKWDLKADSSEALLNAFVYDFTKYVAEKYTGTPNAALQNMLLTVNGIEQSNHLTSLEKYFKLLPSVHQATMLGVEGSTASFKLQVQGSEETLSRLIQLDPDARIALYGLNPDTHKLTFNWRK